MDKGLPPGTLCALSIAIGRASQGNGVSAQMVRATKVIVGAHGLRQLIAPVRTDRERDEGIYVEPNVWTRHSTA